MKFPLFNRKKNNEKDTFNEASAEQQQMINEEKKVMIQGIEELPKTSVKEVMIPRIDVDFISVGTQKDELMSKIADSGHSRFPVYRESIDNVIGVLYVKDLIYAIGKDIPFELESIIKKAYFIPESKRIDSLLREFKKRRLHIAIAIDEYGGVAGIVTMEDIIEEIVGDIRDEFDTECENIIFSEKNIWLCDARTDIDKLNSTINAKFPAEDFDSLGGFVFDLFGKIPVKFEKISWEDYDFIVQDMKGNRINMSKIIKHTEEKDINHDNKE